MRDEAGSCTFSAGQAKGRSMLRQCYIQGFPTDMQVQFTALTVAQGESTMVETVFGESLNILEEMRRMVCTLEIIRDKARIIGGQQPKVQKFLLN